MRHCILSFACLAIAAVAVAEEGFRRFAALGLQVQITKLDVRIAKPTTPEKLVRQAEIYRQALGHIPYARVHRADLRGAELDALVEEIGRV
jgi:GH35 family endo-1,4-beta-xylanase